MCTLFDVIKMKKLYGKEHRGIERSTFIIDGKGILRHELRGIKVPNHVDEVWKSCAGSEVLRRYWPCLDTDANPDVLCRNKPLANPIAKPKTFGYIGP